VKRTYEKYLNVETSTGLTGLEAARKLLDANQLSHVQIEESKGFLSDHYDSSEQVIRLSDSNFNQSTLAGIAIAAHEIGHAIQDANKSRLYRFRKSIMNFIIFSVRIKLQYILIVIGVGMIVLGIETEMLPDTQAMRMASAALILIGVALPVLDTFFPIVTLSVEIDASKRALAMLKELEMINDDEEEKQTKEILDAAALTYVSAVFESAFDE